MKKLGIINLGLTSDKFEEFKQKVLDAGGKDFGEGLYTSHYKEIEPTKIAESCDSLVLSPGNAIVGLLNYDRAKRDRDIGPLYSLIEAAIIEGNVSILGVNAGYEALVNSLGCGIQSVDDIDKGDYHKEKDHDLSQVKDQITEGIDKISMTLTNNWRVEPLGLKDKTGWGQNRIKHIALLDNFALMSKIETTDGAPVYGVQFNIEQGTEPIFRNYFSLAKKYLQKK